MSVEITTLPRQQVIDTRFTQDIIPVLDTVKFEHMQRIATLMSECSFVPLDLRKGDSQSARMATCFLIVNQAVRWHMDPFALIQSAYVISGKLGYDGKTIAAVINTDPRMKGRLDYEFSGDGENRTIVVSGAFKDDGKTRTVEGVLKSWAGTNKLWKADPDQMLTYRGSRQWARRHNPERLLGVYSVDELEDMASRDAPPGSRVIRMKDVTPKHSATVAPDIPDDPPVPDDPDLIDPPLADAGAYLDRLRDLRSQCGSVQELMELSVQEQSMIARLSEADQTKAAEILSEEGEGK